MKFLSHRCFAIYSLLGPLALSCPAAAQDVNAAESLFNRGLTDMEAGWYSTGCPSIAESQRLDPRAGTLFTLSQCEIRWGRIATALTLLRQYLELYEHMTPDQKARQSERYKVAKEQRDKLIVDVPELTLILPAGAPAGTVMKLDDMVVANAALGLGLPVDPGEHLVSTQAPGGSLWEQQFAIDKGEKKPVLLEVKAAPPVMVAPPEPVKKAPPPPFKEGTRGRRTVTNVIGGVGIASLALGSVMGGLVLGKKSIIEAHCTSQAKETGDVFCDQAGVDAGNSAKTLGLVSTIGFAAGVAGVGTAVVLLLTEPKLAKPTTSSRKPWISADVFSVGPTGATLGAYGSF